MKAKLYVVDGCVVIK